MKNFDNVLKFKKEQSNYFGEFIQDFKNKNYFAALRKINLALKEDISSEIYKWKAILFRHMEITGIDAADCHLKTLFSNEEIEQKLAALFLAEFFISEKKYEIVDFYADFVKNSSKNSNSVPPGIQERIDFSFGVVRKISNSKRFLVVDAEFENQIAFSKMKDLIRQAQVDFAEMKVKDIPLESAFFEESNLLLASTFFAQNKMVKAVQFCETVLNKNPENIDALILLAKIKFKEKSKDFPEILQKIKIPLDLFLQIKLLELFLFVNEFELVLQVSKQILNKAFFISQIHFCQGIAFYNLGKVEAAKEEFLTASVLSEKEVYARELYLLLESGSKKLPGKIFVDKAMPKAVIVQVAKRIERFLDADVSAIIKMNFGELKNILLLAEYCLDQRSQREVLTKILKTRKGVYLVKDFLLTFSVSPSFKKLCLFCLCLSGVSLENLPIVVDEKIKYINIIFPKGLFSEINLDEKGAWRTDLPVDFYSFTEAFAEVFVFLAFYLQGFERKLKGMAEKFLLSMQSFPSNLKKLLIKPNVVSALLFSVLSDDVQDGKFLLSEKGKDKLAFVCNLFGTQVFEVRKLLVEIF